MKAVQGMRAQFRTLPDTCFATQEWCTILMGVVFSFFVVVQLLNYAAQELEATFLKRQQSFACSNAGILQDAYKFGRLAGCASFWAFAGWSR